MLETIITSLATIAAIAIIVGSTLLIVYVIRRNTKRSQVVDRIIGSDSPSSFGLSGSPIVITNTPGLGKSSAFINHYYSQLVKQHAKNWVLDFKELISPNKIEMIIEDKKKKFLNIPSISFHYANDEQIKDFYNEYFKEPTIESLVSEITGEVDGDVKGSLPTILESHIGSKDINKWVSTIKLPDASLNGMFLRFQRETIKNGQVTLGTEEVDIELTELQAFEEAINELKDRFNFEIDNTKIEVQKTQLREKAAEKTLVKLEQATGWVLIEGKFKIERTEDFYKCSYLHPVNDYLPEQSNPVTISVSILEKTLKEHIKGNYAQSIGKSIPLKIYGQVWQPVDRKTNHLDLQLTPLAIY